MLNRRKIVCSESFWTPIFSFYTLCVEFDFFHKARQVNGFSNGPGEAYIFGLCGWHGHDSLLARSPGYCCSGLGETISGIRFSINVIHALAYNSLFFNWPSDLHISRERNWEANSLIRDLVFHFCYLASVITWTPFSASLSFSFYPSCLNSPSLSTASKRHPPSLMHTEVLGYGKLPSRAGQPIVMYLAVTRTSINKFTDECKLIKM